MTHFSIYYVVSKDGKELTWGSMLVDEKGTQSALMRVLLQLQEIMPTDSEAMVTFHQLKQCAFHVRGDDSRPLTTITDTFQEDAVHTFVWGIKKYDDKMVAIYPDTNTVKLLHNKFTFSTL